MEDTVEITFPAGEIVLYRRYGVCKITAIEAHKFGETEKTYYQLEPVFTNKPTKFFVPADAEGLEFLIRAILDKKQLTASVKEAKEYPLDWLEDSKIRLASYEKLLKTGSAADMVRLVRLLTFRKHHQRAIGRSFLDCDRRILVATENLITEELMYVLGMERNDVSELLLEDLVIE